MRFVRGESATDPRCRHKQGDPALPATWRHHRPRHVCGPQARRRRGLGRDAAQGRPRSSWQGTSLVEALARGLTFPCRRTSCSPSTPALRSIASRAASRRSRVRSMTLQRLTADVAQVLWTMYRFACRWTAPSSLACRMRSRTRPQTRNGACSLVLGHG